MGILIWIVLGAIAGVVAKYIMPGPQPGGIIATIVLGIVGALVGGFIASALGLGAVGGFNLGSIVIAILGAILVLFIYQMVVSKRGGRPKV